MNEDNNGLPLDHKKRRLRPSPHLRTSPTIQRAIDPIIKNNNQSLADNLKLLGYEPTKITNMLSNDTLEGAYRIALGYIKNQDLGESVLTMLEQREDRITVYVGAPVSQANQDLLTVNWNPYEYYFITNVSTSGQQEGHKFDANQIIGINSSALTLFHELGHIKQSLELRDADIPKEGSEESTHSDLEQMIREVVNNANQVLKWAGKEGDELLELDAREVMEDDNLRRHEQPMAAALNEVARPSYNYAITEDLVTNEAEDTARQDVNRIRGLDPNKRITNTDKTFEDSQDLAAIDILEFLDQMKVAAQAELDNINGWQKNVQRKSSKNSKVCIQPCKQALAKL